MNSEHNNTRSQLKFITCGSVDDGKSTLIGHILYDSKKLYVDQIQSLELDSKIGSRGGKLDYSLLLDGLLAEREQGITIDVAYRYFNTDKRSFIVADTPGHEEYTRNMAVGASFADLAIILLDATKGVLSQTKRHARICKLMGIKNFVFAINKMDLVDYQKSFFDQIAEQIKLLSDNLKLDTVYLIPVSATEGDNVTVNNHSIAWYEGLGLLEYLEQVDIKDNNKNETGFYLPVQRVCRPNREFRGFQGQIESGNVSIGEELTALPSGEKARVKSIHVGMDSVDSAQKGQPVNIELDREIDISRGCVLEKDSGIKIATNIDVLLLWMDDLPLESGKEFFIKQGNKITVGVVDAINYAINVNTGEEKKTEQLRKNEIANCSLSFYDPVVVDLFDNHKALGELILIDRVSNMTSACGVVTSIGEQVGNLTNEQIRAELTNTQNNIFYFDVTNNINLEQIVKQVERRLLLSGINAYIYNYADNSSEVSDGIIEHLSKAGVVTLVLVNGANKQSLELLDKVKEITSESIFNYIKNQLQ